MFKAPQFWYNKKKITWHYVLMPISVIYGVVSFFIQIFKTKTILDVPVICVGNIVMGGAGKTPVVIELVELLKKMGYHPHILTRGYGGKVKEPTCVDLNYHTYQDVGDEAMLLAQHAPTWAYSNRLESAKKAINYGATILILDDGYQNHQIHKDFNILVVDSYQKFGNNFVFPLGPLREFKSQALKRCDLIINIAYEEKSDVSDIFSKQTTDIPIMQATAQFTLKNPPKGNLQGKSSVVGFCGLGFPEKFKQTLINNLKINLKDFIIFPDHHPYTTKDLDNLLNKHPEAQLLTTIKDFVKIPKLYQTYIDVVSMKLLWDDELIKKFIKSKIYN